MAGQLKPDLYQCRDPSLSLSPPVSVSLYKKAHSRSVPYFLFSNTQKTAICLLKSSRSSPASSRYPFLSSPSKIGRRRNEINHSQNI